MKKVVLIVFIGVHSFVFCQEKLIEGRDVLQNNIEIITDGLDDILIENSIGNELEIELYDENPNTHDVLFKEIEETIKIQFKLNFKSTKNEVFRKYITKRLHRARAIIKVPKNKQIILHGQTIGIVSKNYQGNISIFIHKGNIKLNKVKGNIEIALFQGNIYGEVSNVTLDLKTNKGMIKLNNEEVVSPFYKKHRSSKTVIINSINANIDFREL